MFDEMLQCPQRHQPLLIDQRRYKSHPEIAPNCPRCASPNTKFCYYNNYSLSQPRYFCKGCRRYWTKGGSLRNVPVGGGCRKTRRNKSSRQTSSSSSSAPTFSPNPPSSSPGAGDPSPEIDLAAVFANFLNRSSENTENSSGTSSMEIGNMIGDVLPDDGADFINGFELHDMIGDDLPVTESLPGFGWETSEFGSFLPDDQLKISNNLIGENWGSFDVLGYELFSRP